MDLSIQEKLEMMATIIMEMVVVPFEVLRQVMSEVEQGPALVNSNVGIAQ